MSYILCYKVTKNKYLSGKGISSNYFTTTTLEMHIAVRKEDIIEIKELSDFDRATNELDWGWLEIRYKNQNYFPLYVKRCDL